MKRAASSDWPVLLTPEPLCYPPATEPRGDERVLHLAMLPSLDVHRMMERGFRRLGDYVEIDWGAEFARGTLAATACALAQRLRPTMVFVQAQGHPCMPLVMQAVKSVCDPSCVCVQWDGDLHHKPEDAERAAFVALGRVCDTSLTVETAYQGRYAALGVNHPGFLEIGLDEKVWNPQAPPASVPPIVLLANHYPHDHMRRAGIILELDRFLGPARFGVYGSWAGANVYSAHPLIPLNCEASVYAGSVAALNISICADVARYTSDRLIRMLLSGALPIVEYFPDCEGLGLIDRVNCLLWRTMPELFALCNEVLAIPSEPRWTAMRAAAAALGLEHTWYARVCELQAIVDAVRASRC